MQANEHLALWKRPDCYVGPEWTDYYVVLSRHRDSDALTRSNWRIATGMLEAEADKLGDAMLDKAGDSFLQVVSDRHWAVGWIEFIYLHKDAPESILTVAGEIVCSIADYPALDEDDWSNLEFDEACEYWESCSVRDRVDLIQRAYPSGGVSVFAARRDELPEDPNGSLLEYLRC